MTATPAENRSPTAPSSTASTAATEIIIRPQPGPQVRFLSSSADIAVYGGAAGGGKSWSLLFDPFRYHAVPRFRAVIFRRTAPEITAAGGLWEESFDLYGKLGAVPQVTRLRWDWPGGGSVRFGHMQYETDLLKFHSAQIPWIGFDELTTFTERQFVYMLSRNRSPSGVLRPYIRATTNPDADSWVAKWVAWYVGPDGYPIPERSGVVRWFVREGEVMHWADSPADLAGRFPDQRPKSFTFVPAKLTDNRILMEKDPGYLANLQAQTEVDRERLLGGNWKVRQTGTWFDRAKVVPIPTAPVGTVAVRYWDTAAATGEAACRTAGVLIGKTPMGQFVVLDCAAGKWTPLERNRTIVSTAHLDRHRAGVKVTKTWVEQEPGGSGLEAAQTLIRELAGFTAGADKVTGDKDERARPFATQWQAGNVLYVPGDWSEDFFAELGRIPGGKYRDRADAAAGAFNKLTAGGEPGVPQTAPAGQTVTEQLPDWTFR